MNQPAAQPKLILLDLDGTLYIGDEPIAGAIAAIDQLRNAGFTLRFLTNTTTKSRNDLLTQLTGMGFKLEVHELISTVTATQAELRIIQQLLNKPISLWPVVADAVKWEFAEFAINEKNPDFIVLGDIGDQWDIQLINRLFNAMHNGAELIAMHKNRFWQTANGLQADIGLFVAGLEYVTQKNARIIGKPSSVFFSQVLASANTAAADTILVGDDLDSDVGGAQTFGIKGYLVKTGKYREAYLARSAIKPDAILPSIAHLPSYLGL